MPRNTVECKEDSGSSGVDAEPASSWFWSQSSDQVQNITVGASPQSSTGPGAAGFHVPDHFWGAEEVLLLHERALKIHLNQRNDSWVF